MAASYGTNPMILDAAAQTYTGRILVSMIQWVGTTAGDDLILKDNNGNVILQAKTDGRESEYYPDRIFNGVIVDTIDSGVVYIYN